MDGRMNVWMDEHMKKEEMWRFSATNPEWGCLKMTLSKSATFGGVLWSKIGVVSYTTSPNQRLESVIVH